ncbi:MAG: hypothetical protein ACFBSE_22300 [Prochloraceae cyanobacterium]
MVAIELLNLFPLYLVFLTLGSIVFPTCISFTLRRNLYKHILTKSRSVKKLLDGNSAVNKPKIVYKVENRFETASKQLEKVNTPALIDGIYSEEKFNFLGFSLTCETWDYFCQVLPNLLLSFGLLGTFLGITINLHSLSSTISQVNISDVSSLIQKLQQPLEAMGIAFITSLIAIGCSSFLTLINLRYNTTFAKYQLISTLEDYLDNILHPTIDGHSRLDKAVNRMVDKQNEFLNRFHEKVGQVLESTIEHLVEKIIEENKRSNQLAREVYQRLLESSGSLAKGADTFKESVYSLKKETEKLVTVSNNFEKGCDIFKESSILFSVSAEKIEASKFSENLENLTKNLATTQTSFARSTSLLAENTDIIVQSNIRANQLAEQVYQQFQDCSDRFDRGSNIFLNAATKINESEFANNILTATADLASTQKDFSQSASALNKSTQSIDSVIQTLDNSIKEVAQLGAKQLNKLEQQATSDRHSINTVASNISTLETTINKMVHSEEKYLQEIRTDSKQLIEFFSSDRNSIARLEHLLKTGQNNLNAIEKHLQQIQSKVSTKFSGIDLVKKIS